MLFEEFAPVVYYGDDLPTKLKWVSEQHFRNIKDWSFPVCADFLLLSPTVQGKLPGSESVSWTKTAVRARLFATAGFLYMRPQFKHAPVGPRQSYEVLGRELAARTINQAQQKATVPNPVVVKRGNGRTMNELIRQVQERVQSNKTNGLRNSENDDML
jgi:hypothetical protein